MIKQLKTLTVSMVGGANVATVVEMLMVGVPRIPCHQLAFYFLLAVFQTQDDCHFRGGICACIFTHKRLHACKPAGRYA